MKALAALMLTGLAAFGAVQGTVENLTTGKPQPGAVVTLVELSGGMKTAGSVKSDAQGKFVFDQVTPSAQTPYLLQAVHQGVTYNKMLPPGTAGTPVAMEVYDAAAKVPEAKVTQDMILLERADNQLVVNETVIFSNDAKTTFQSNDGTLKIRVPADITGPVKMRITAPQGMPISREPEKGKEPNTWVVKYPIKPGETRIDFSYVAPANGDATEFKGRILHGGGPVRFVAPQGIKLESPALTDLGPEPRTQATVYELKGAEYNVKVSGSGQLRASASGGSDASGGGASDENASESPGLDTVKPRIYTRLPWVVGLTFGMLAIGFIALYNRGARA